MKFLQTTIWFFKKEWWLWWASPTHFLMPFLFSAIVVTLMGLLWEPPVSHQKLIASIWLTLLFGGVLRFIKGSDPENESQIFLLYRLSSKVAVPFFVSKFVMNFIYLLILFVMSFFLFNLYHPVYHLGEIFFTLLSPFILWLIGFTLLGTVFSGMLLGYEKRDATLALLLYPFLMPAIVALLKCFLLNADGDIMAIEKNWVYFLVIFDGIYLLMSLFVQEMLFE